MIDGFLNLPPLAQAVICLGGFVVALAIVAFGATAFDDPRPYVSDVDLTDDGSDYL